MRFDIERRGLASVVNIINFINDVKWRLSYLSVTMHITNYNQAKSLFCLVYLKFWILQTNNSMNTTNDI